MNTDELMAKVGQIEEQARYTLEEFPKGLTKERLRMIIALTKHIRSEIDRAGITPDPDQDQTVPGISPL